VSKHVVIIGGGVIGLCSAYYARQRGFDVTVVDRGNTTTDTCSTGNAGMIVPSHFIPLAAPGMVSMGIKMMLNPKSPFGFKLPPTLDQILWSWKYCRACTKHNVEKTEFVLRDLNLFSRAEYEKLTDSLGAGFGLEKRGLFALFKSDEKLDHEKQVAERAEQIGVRAEVIGIDEVRRRDPEIKIDAVGAVHFLDDAHLTPSVFLNELRKWLVQNGAKFIEASEVDRFDIESGKIRKVRFGDKEVEGDEFVLASGVWSSNLAKLVGLKVPMMAGKGYSMVLENPPAMPSICSLLMEARVAVTPMQNGLRIAGTMELGEPDFNVNENRLSGIRDSVEKYYPQVTPEMLKNLPIWQGHRPCSPDGMPFLGRTKRIENLVIATGHSMMGLSLGPISGKLVSEILSADKPIIPLALMDPERYG
jgi:D-amino-acid dehydrogenase